MYTYWIIADDFIIEIQSQSVCLNDYFEKKIADFENLCLSFSRLENEIDCDSRICYIDADDYSIEFDEQNISLDLRCPWKQIDNSTILPMTLRLLIEYLRQKRGEIRLHASAVEWNGRSAIFLAPSEGGKTTVALSLCHHHQFVLKANDVAIVKYIDGIPYIVRGDTKLKMRKNGLQAYSSLLNCGVRIQESEQPWNDRYSFLAEDLGATSSSSPSEIKYLFFIKLDNMMDNCSIIKYDMCANYDTQKKWFKQKMMLTQSISGTIKGSDLMPIGNQGELLPLFIPSLDNEILNQMRNNAVNNLFNRCYVYQLRGRLEMIEEFITSLMF